MHLPKKSVFSLQSSSLRPPFSVICHLLISFFTSLCLTTLIFVLSTAYLQPQKVHAQKGISPAERGQVLGEKTLLAKLYLKGSGATPSQIKYGTDIGFDADGNGTAEVTITNAGNLDFTKKLTEDGVEILSGVKGYFAGPDCPTGWTEDASATNRVVRVTAAGGASTGGADTHTHSVNPPDTATTAESSHTHTSDIYAANVVGTVIRTGTGTSYTHVQDAADYEWYATIVTSSVVSFGFRTPSAAGSSHSHTMNIAAFDSVSGSTLPSYIEYILCTKSAGSDYAEWIKTKEKYPPGTVVSVNPEAKEQIKITQKTSDPALLGVISTAPGWIVGKERDDSLLLSLSGQVPVNVSTVSGPIKPGDSLTSSNIAGTAMKAIQAGPILGKALEEFDPQNNKGKSIPCPPNSPQNIQCGQIAAFVDLSWYDPQVFLTSTGDLHLEGSPEEDLVLKDKDDNLITQIGAFAEIAVAKIKAGLIQTKKLTVDDIDILEKLNQLSNKVASQQTEIDSLKKEIEELKNKYKN